MASNTSSHGITSLIEMLNRSFMRSCLVFEVMYAFVLTFQINLAASTMYMVQVIHIMAWPIAMVSPLFIFKRLGQ